jgi:hypothetical protein
MKRQWLKDWPWEIVVTINVNCVRKRKLCTNLFPTVTNPPKNFGKNRAAVNLLCGKLSHLCRQCHKLAPFCFYNGNTFAAIGRTLIQDLLRKMPPVKAHSFRSVVGHYIAGTIGEDELSKTLESLR